ncbi:hypothetical protein CDAR_542761 [Caerostris darwini]|uniref:Uncharacterized protein n=1 Tax=Caerostris darwini TaxID=1538125 RepID=A0AAV4WY09_9ARAC|nr:hypothetical protein CDAR_542761 [Caerostris darwini]
MHSQGGGLHGRYSRGPVSAIDAKVWFLLKLLPTHLQHKSPVHPLDYGSKETSHWFRPARAFQLTESIQPLMQIAQTLFPVSGQIGINTFESWSPTDSLMICLQNVC